MSLRDRYRSERKPAAQHFLSITRLRLDGFLCSGKSLGRAGRTYQGIASRVDRQQSTPKSICGPHNEMFLTQEKHLIGVARRGDRIHVCFTHQVKGRGDGGDGGMNPPKQKI